MQMSDLMNMTVSDNQGATIGRVTDVRLVQDGPYIEGFGNALVVDALIVGGGGIASRLGFVRGGVRGPWPLGVMASALEGRCHVVSWVDVQVTDTGLTLSRRRHELARVRDLGGWRP